MPVTARTWLLIAALGLLSLSAAEALSAPPLEPEISDVATLPPSSPHRFFTAKLRNSSFVIFDGDSGKMEGNIPAGYIANLAIAPDNSQFFVSETYWAHGARGERQDLLSVYDSRTLNLVKEIPLPGRALVMKMQNFDISASGSRAYVYIMLPASSVVWVDLKKQVVGGTVEIPGCALVFPWGEEGFSSLCADGSLATVTLPESGQAKVTHTKPFLRQHRSNFREQFCRSHNGHRDFHLLYRPCLSGKARCGHGGGKAVVDAKGSRFSSGRHRRAGIGLAPRRRPARGLSQGERQAIRTDARGKLLDPSTRRKRDLGARYQDSFTAVPFSAAAGPDQRSRRR